MARRLVSNEIFLENVPDAFIEEFACIREPLPSLLVNILEDANHDITSKRIDFYRKFPELEEMDEMESVTVLKLLDDGKKDEAAEFQIGCAIEFLKRNPQFKIMVDRVESPASGIIRMISDTIRQAFLGDL